jgi:hypothetical protein
MGGDPYVAVVGKVAKVHSKVLSKVLECGSLPLSHSRALVLDMFWLGK